MSSDDEAGRGLLVQLAEAVDEAVADLELLAKVAAAGDGAVASIALACISLYCCVKYNFKSSALTNIRQAPNVNKISDLRQLLEKDNDNGKLVVVRGIVEAKESIGSGGWRSLLRPDALVFNEAGERAVVVQSTQTVPFVLLDIGRSSTADYLLVNMHHSKHPLPLSTVYRKLQPIQASPCTFSQIVFGHAYPVALLDEEKVLSVGKKISAVGICSFKDGVPQIKSSRNLPYFLTEKTKDQLVEDLTFQTKCLFWGGLILGSLSIGILGYATVRNWGRWNRWRQRRQNLRILEADMAAAVAAEDTESQSDEVAGEVPDGELCIICLVSRRRAAFDPCGHMVCCQRCAFTVRLNSSPKCPVCRQTIDNSFLIHTS
ncbi:hypothetical protein MKW94_019057 [Papaver nudicaule]|uniref:RING-type E3 ubiquitin transferase n=1 Tax=Papaver nudicaule TaxID=74823 RepID=A0AA41UXY6_PAPNU|nr:hypothetical protein [Papaver nudicaule]